MVALTNTAVGTSVDGERWGRERRYGNGGVVPAYREVQETPYRYRYREECGREEEGNFTMSVGIQLPDVDQITRFTGKRNDVRFCLIVIGRVVNYRWVKNPACRSC